MKFPTIILVRHGQTKWNVEGRYQGRLNSDLTEKGKEQAKSNALKIAKVLNLDEPFKIYSSPLGRAKESSYIICDELGIDRKNIIFDERILEFNYGIFEGKTKTYCQNELKEQFEAREVDKWNYTLESGESYTVVTRRVEDWLNSIKDEKNVVLIAHEMVNRALRGLYCHLKKEAILKLRQPNDILIKLENGLEFIIR